MACYFLENHSRIARLKQPSFENLENAVSRGGSLRKAAPLLGIESLNVLYFPFSEATPIYTFPCHVTARGPSVALILCGVRSSFQLLHLLG